jgi:hypothetical protein
MRVSRLERGHYDEVLPKTAPRIQIKRRYYRREPPHAKPWGLPAKNFFFVKCISAADMVKLNGCSENRAKLWPPSAHGRIEMQA